MSLISAHAAATPKIEVCGLLFGSTGLIDGARRCDNVADDPVTSFEIDPVALIGAYKAQRSGGPQVLGCYHSHPDGACRPSLRDAAGADQPGTVWMIITRHQTGVWHVSSPGRFDRCRLQIID